jgi:hypothetical protein
MIDYAYNQMLVSEVRKNRHHQLKAQIILKRLKIKKHLWVKIKTKEIIFDKSLKGKIYKYKNGRTLIIKMKL